MNTAPTAIRHPQFSGLVHFQREFRPPGDEASTAHTVALMAQYVREDSRSPLVRRAALAATHGRPTPREQLDGVFRWVKARVRFQLDEITAAGVADDPASAELLIRPVDLLTMPVPAGDCDDFAMLSAALLRSLGFETRFRTVAASASAPDSYSHVYTLARANGEWVALDCSHGPHLGWEVPPAGKTKTWSVDTMHESGGLGAIDWGSILKSGIDAGATIAKSRWGQPPAGTYQQDGDRILYRAPEGSNQLAFPGIGVNVGPGGGGSALLLLGGAALLVLLIVLKGQR
ncbi:MAG TPA: hypothetical protein DEH78_23440 [Solibacterales bacterium]|nr:hypothetical protein [Bryobacterales bacterium]